MNLPPAALRAFQAHTAAITTEALIEVLITRLLVPQAGRFPSREKAVALTKLEEASMWLERGVKTFRLTPAEPGEMTTIDAAGSDPS